MARALQLGEVITAIRTRHPAYADETLVPLRGLIDHLGRTQRRLALRGAEAYSAFLEQVAPIYLDLSSANVPGVAGAGTSGGLPADPAVDSPNMADATAGAAIRFPLEQATVLKPDFVPTSVGALTVTETGAGRTVNGDVGLLLWVVRGPGAGPQAARAIISNTADTWTLAPALTPLPTTQSVCRLVQVPAAAIGGGVGSVVTQLPSTERRVGYLVRLNAAGVAYLDLSKPLIATLTKGVPLPPHLKLLSLSVLQRAPNVSAGADPGTWPQGAMRPAGIPIYHHSLASHLSFGAYVRGEELHLVGAAGDWASVPALELRYVPDPPLFDVASRQVLEAYFLLPQSAMDALVGHGALYAAQQAAARKAGTVDVLQEKADAAESTEIWLSSLRARVGALRRPSRPLR